MANEVFTGTIKFYNKEKAFGFITPDHGAADIFFHISGLVDKGIKENDAVSYSTKTGKK